MTPGLDPTLQAPARLRLTTMLTAVSEAEFATLRDALDVSDSVLSKHVSALAAEGYVRSRKGVHAGRVGWRSRRMPLCSGVRPPLRRLQTWQEQTMFSQVDCPPWERGTTWSRFSSWRGSLRPQYWHVWRSRA